MHIEDNKADARLVEIYLSGAKEFATEQFSFEYQLTHKDSLKDAFLIEDKNQFDVALLDLSLPDGVGLETLEKFLKEYPNLPTIVLTGREPQELGLGALQLGAVDFLSKQGWDSWILLKSISFACIRVRNEKLEKAKELAEKTVEMRERFLANMSHELRTPLNAVIGIADILDQLDHTNEQHTYIKTLKISANNLFKLINSILDISKIESDKLQLEEHSFDLSVFLQELIQLYKYKTSAKKLRFFTQFDAFLPTQVVGDSLRLNQVLINLLDNAVKYTEEGKIILEVLLLDETDENVKIEFSIQDTGIGIEEAKLEKIFESFVQATKSTTRLYGGTGLGLSIAQQLVTLFGGDLIVESKLNEGSTFKFAIELKKANSTETTDKPAESLQDIEPVKENIEILIVEDEKTNQMVVTRLLQNWSKSIKIDIANNGEEGLQQLNRKDYDLIMMDISMPVMDGMEATQHIRREFAAPKCHTPIIATTAHALESVEEQCFNIGMNDFATKPINAKELYKKINKILNANSDRIIDNSSVSAPTPQMPTPQVEASAIFAGDTAPMTNELGVDLAYFDEVTQGDLDFKYQLVDELVGDVPLEIEKLKNCYTLNNFEGYYKVAHKLKSSFTYIGLRGNDKVVECLFKPEMDNPKISFSSECFNEFLTVAEKAIKYLKTNFTKVKS